MTHRSLSPVLSELPEFISGRDLITLGLFRDQKAIHMARKRGYSPDYVYLGRRIVYPKQGVISFLEQLHKSGSNQQSKAVDPCSSDLADLLGRIDRIEADVKDLIDRDELISAEICNIRTLIEQ